MLKVVVRTKVFRQREKFMLLIGDNLHLTHMDMTTCVLDGLMSAENIFFGSVRLLSELFQQPPHYYLY